MGILAQQRKFGFTLAEVLITLGVIGVVAALTLPTVMSNYRKKVVETKLKTFYSTINQAMRFSENEYGSVAEWDLDTEVCGGTSNSEANYSEECLTEFFNKYLKPNLKYDKVVYGSHPVKLSDDETYYFNSGLFIYFANGSICQILYKGQDYLFYIDEKALKAPEFGRNVFAFAFYPKGSALSLRDQYFKNRYVEPYIRNNWDGTQAGLYNCNTKGMFCGHTKVIQMNNWEIPKDYPIKF